MKINSINRLAISTVLAVFILIFLGALVTSWQAGMAVPDWPLSFGSLNPDGWWGRFDVRLEHGHRVLAASIGVLVACLCSAVWGNWRALGYAASVSVCASTLGRLMGGDASTLAHISVWPAAVAFLLALTTSKQSPVGIGRPEKILAVAAFVLVCIQATLGGLRVTRETAGFIDLAIVLRVLHGCVAQLFLLAVVSLAVRVSILSSKKRVCGFRFPKSVSKFSWLALGAVYCQLILGAAMRHQGAGLAIPLFPQAELDGSWLPKVHNLHADLNFLHTRIGALVVTTIVLISVVVMLRHCAGFLFLRGSAVRSLVLLTIQIVLGIFLIWHLKPPILATFHVLVGAGLLANLAASLVHILSLESASTSGGDA